MPSLKRSIVHWTGAAVLLAITLASGKTWSQQPAPQSSPAATPALQLFVYRLRADVTLDRYLTDLLEDFFQIDADGDGRLTQHDVDLHTLMDRIQLRSIAMNLVTRFDLDGDGAVTEDEIRRGKRYQLRILRGHMVANRTPPAAIEEAMQTQIDSSVRSIMAMDADKDGKVDYSEAGTFSPPPAKPGTPSYHEQSGRARRALTLDNGANGTVTLEEYQRAGEALFRKVDSDRDGRISEQELAEYRRQPDTAARP